VHSLRLSGPSYYRSDQSYSLDLTQSDFVKEQGREGKFTDDQNTANGWLVAEYNIDHCDAQFFSVDCKTHK